MQQPRLKCDFVKLVTTQVGRQFLFKRLSASLADAERIRGCRACIQVWSNNMSWSLGRMARAESTIVFGKNEFGLEVGSHWPFLLEKKHLWVGWSQRSVLQFSKSCGIFLKYRAVTSINVCPLLYGSFTALFCTGNDLEPPAKKPRLETGGIPPYVKCSSLQDKRRVLTQDRSNKLTIWDVTNGLETELPFETVSFSFILLSQISKDLKSCIKSPRELSFLRFPAYFLFFVSYSFSRNQLISHPSFGDALTPDYSLCAFVRCFT